MIYTVIRYCIENAIIIPSKVDLILSHNFEDVTVANRQMIRLGSRAYECSRCGVSIQIDHGYLKRLRKRIQGLKIQVGTCAEEMMEEALK